MVFFFIYLILITYIKKARFEPAYDIYSCLECEIENFTKPISDCILNGRFCANDPDGPNVG